MSEQKPQTGISSGATSTPPVDAASPDAPPPLDRSAPQLTARAIVTGLVLGGVLSACNIYLGLVLGLVINMSILAVLLSYAFWLGPQDLFGTRPWGMLENTISLTACAAGALVASAGLIAPIPALTMLTGQTLSWPALSLWVFSVCLVGIAVGIPIRRQMLLVDKLPFPVGLATAETLREMYAKGAEALSRVKMLLGGALVAGGLKILETYKGILQWLLSWGGRKSSFALHTWAPAAKIKGFSLSTLTWGLDPSLLLVAVGGMIGFRACVSLIIGSIAAWLVIAPPLIRDGHIRLVVSEPLPALAPDVRAGLRPEPLGYARYESETRLLKYKGVMTAAERGGLLALSDEPRFQEAVRRLYARSQLEIAAPLAQLPSGVNLAGMPVEFDAARGMLRATAGVSHVVHDRLREQSDDSAFRAAVDALCAYFDYPTSRAVPARVALKDGQWPPGFLVPRELTPRIDYLAPSQQLVAFGALDDQTRQSLRAALQTHAEKNPATTTACNAASAALDQLHEKSNIPLALPADGIPAALATRVTIDPQARRITAHGILTDDDQKLLQALWATDAEASVTVAALVAATQFSPVRPGFADVVQWLLWPGVTLMVVASLVSFGFSWRSMVRTFTRLGKGQGTVGAADADTGEVTAKWFGLALLCALVLSLALQTYLFHIAWWAAFLGVLLSFALALVAARVAGETSQTPVGAMGKVTQLVFGALTPNNPVPNLMAANVTGGAASQCADLLADLKAGYLLGASPRKQVIAQILGALIGSMAGSAFYLIMVPNPTQQLMTTQYPAPGVAAWKAVAELFMAGVGALPSGTGPAILIAGVVGLVLPILERVLPKKARSFIPSAPSLGLAFVIQGSYAASMFIGGVLALVLAKAFPNWSRRFTMTLCAGLIAGESLVGVGVAFQRIITG